MGSPRQDRSDWAKSGPIPKSLSLSFASGSRRKTSETPRGPDRPWPSVANGSIDHPAHGKPALRRPHGVRDGRGGMHDVVTHTVAAETLEGRETGAGDGPLDRGAHVTDRDPGFAGLDRGRQGLPRGLDHAAVARPAHVHRGRGVDDPPVDVHSDVQLGEVSGFVRPVVVGGGTVVSGHRVDRGLGGKRGFAAAFLDLRLDRLADLPERGPRHDELRAQLTHLAGDGAGAPQRLQDFRQGDCRPGKP